MSFDGYCRNEDVKIPLEITCEKCLTYLEFIFDDAYPCFRICINEILENLCAKQVCLPFWIILHPKFKLVFMPLLFLSFFLSQ